MGEKPKFGARSKDEYDTVLGVPVANAPEVWHVAHIHALKEIRKLLVGLHESKSLSPMEFKQRLLEVIDHLNDGSDEHWHKFIGLNAFHDLAAESMEELGIPDILYLEEGSGLVAVGWLELSAEDSTYWNPISIPLPDDSQDRQYQVTPAFRPILPAKLPEGALKFEIGNAEHASMLCIIDVLNSMIGDIQAVAADAPADLAWKWVRKLSQLYRDQFDFNKSKIVRDDFKDWSPELPANIPLPDAPEIIGRTASNARMVRTLALYTTVACLEDAIDRAQYEPYTTSAEERVAQVIRDLVRARTKLQPEFDAKNSRLIGNALEDMPGATLYMIARPIPNGPPIIALIPEDKGAVVNALPAKKAEPGSGPA